MKLYHYCSNDAFLKILQTNEIWAPDLSLSNDSLEGRWIRHIFLKVCKAKGISPLDLERLTVQIDGLIGFFGAGGFCMSEEEDLLSQWRGYADNGAGISIGFTREYLERLSESGQREFGVALRQTIYDPKAQEEQIEPYITKIISQIGEGALRLPMGTILSPMADEEKAKIAKSFANLTMTILTMFPLLYALKNPAFSEEKEWRLISYIAKAEDRYEDADLPHIDFFTKSDRVVPVRHIALEDMKVQSIVRVVLGPRNITPKHVIAAALKKYGFGDVEVSTSSASYR